METAPAYFSDLEACVDALIEYVGYEMTLGLPLGLGKPVRLANALYHRAKADSRLKLHIVTAISPLAPSGSSSLERRFMEPFVERLYGDIPELAYARAVTRHELPDNVRVSEFFFHAGSFLNHSQQQQNYVCTNYTHAVRDLLAMGVNVVAQMVAPDPDNTRSEPATNFSLSCNPDLSLDLAHAFAQRPDDAPPVALMAETNRQLPYLGNDAVVPASMFDFIVDRPQDDYPLFPVPQQPVAPADHLIGFYASTLLRDGGTLQVGIGSLGAAVVHSTILRHNENAAWRAVYDHLQIADRFPEVESWGGTGVFDEGLYGCSEMMVDGFIHLLKADVLKRPVFDDVGLQELINSGGIGYRVNLAMLDCLRNAEMIASPLRARDVQWLQQYGILHHDVEYRGGRLVIGEITIEPDLDSAEARERLAASALGDRLSGGMIAHGGFYIGPSGFYEQLRQLPQADAARICMTSVNYINDLYDHRFGSQRLKVAQRRESRFINSAMMATLDGALVSDGLEDGRVVSGVGGQYNFVAMAHELPRARSMITLRSTRHSGGALKSNIVFSYGHCTIPRHLRDLVITEYGIADVRGRSDQDVYLALIRIADSRFQAGLLKQAQKAGKVAASFHLPESWCHNRPESVKAALRVDGYRDSFPAFPFGCDFTNQELTLVSALQHLKTATQTPTGKLATLWGAVRERPADNDLKPLLERMALLRPGSWREHLDQRLLIHGLRQTM